MGHDEGLICFAWLCFKAIFQSYASKAASERVGLILRCLRTCVFASSLDVQNQQKHRWNKDEQNAGNKAKLVSFHETLPTPK